jgi:hypothetical protein
VYSAIDHMNRRNNQPKNIMNPIGVDLLIGPSLVNVVALKLSLIASGNQIMARAISGINGRKINSNKSSPFIIVGIVNATNDT